MPSTGGCRLERADVELDHLEHGLQDPVGADRVRIAHQFAEAVRDGVDAWRHVVAQAAMAGIPTPAFSSSLAYYDGLRRDRLPAALIQGLRDNFGAHTYRRVDAEGAFHTLWAEDRSEVSR